MQFTPIGTLHSTFVEKFGAPRQSGMVPSARAVLRLERRWGTRESLAHLEGFSHVWLLYVFHRHLDAPFRPTVEPPRLEAPKRVGVFASRSPHRPNPLGLSAVKLEFIDFEAPRGVELHLSGVDVLDGTPVLDLKPYLPYADSIPEAHGGWADAALTRYPVRFAEGALEPLPEAERESRRQLLIELLQWDPRPRPQRETMPIGNPTMNGREFAFRFGGFDVRWQIADGAICVLGLEAPRA